MPAKLTRRIAAAPHSCGSNTSRYCSPIDAGDAYLEVTSYHGLRPPERVKQCVYCAAVDGNDYLLIPVPASQDYRYWDIDSEALARDRADAWPTMQGR
jgi:hypothetical protein